MRPTLDVSVRIAASPWPLRRIQRPAAEDRVARIRPPLDGRLERFRARDDRDRPARRRTRPAAARTSPTTRSTTTCCRRTRSLDLSFEGTFDEFSQHLQTLPIWAAPPVREPSHQLPDVGLRERRAGSGAAPERDWTSPTALGIEPQPVRFILSLRLGDPPDIARVNDWLAVAPWLEFKLDAENSWSRELIEELGATGLVRQVDLKGFYIGTEVDNPPTERLYRDVVECFTDAWIEDPAFTDETRPMLESVSVSSDSPGTRRCTRSPTSRRSSFAPQGMNIKPSRFGPLSELLAVDRVLPGARHRDVLRRPVRAVGRSPAPARDRQRVLSGHAQRRGADRTTTATIRSRTPQRRRCRSRRPTERAGFSWPL